MESFSEITVRYAETDRMGITHHSVYPIWYEVARTDFIKKLGISYSDMEKLGIMLPVTDVTAHYIGTTGYEDELILQATIQQLSVSRVTFAYRVYQKGTQKPVNTGTTTHGFVSSGTFRPINLKKQYPDIYNMLAQAVQPAQSEKIDS